jgi:hypothetical protein
MAVTTAAIVGIAATAGTTAMSFKQAGNQRKLQRKAEDEAAEAMNAARKKLDVNFYEQLAIQKEPYELEREALLSAGAQAIEAGQESERGAAATAGRIYMGQQEGQRQIAGAMGQEMAGLEKITAAEDARLAGVQANLDLATAQGAQLAARDANEAANLATQQGMAGVTNLAGQVASSLPLFAKTKSARITNQIEDVASKKYGLQQSDIQKSIGSIGTVDNIDFSKVGGMSELQFKDFMGKVNPETLRKIQAQFPNLASSFMPDEYKSPNLFSQSSTLGAFAIPGIGG